MEIKEIFGDGDHLSEEEIDASIALEEEHGAVEPVQSELAF